MNGWAAIVGAWSQGWKELRARAATLYAVAAQSDPSGTAARITGFTQALGETRVMLDRIQLRLLGQDMVARYQELDRRWHDLAAGLFADATPVAAPSVGVPPALVVGGLAITAVGLAWAFAAYEYALNLQEQTQLAERELEARIQASQQGRVLPPSTLPAVPPGNPSMGLWLLGGLALTAGVLVVPLWLGRR